MRQEHLFLWLKVLLSYPPLYIFPARIIISRPVFKSYVNNKCYKEIMSYIIVAIRFEYGCCNFGFGSFDTVNNFLFLSVDNLECVLCRFKLL